MKCPLTVRCVSYVQSRLPAVPEAQQLARCMVLPNLTAKQRSVPCFSLWVLSRHFFLGWCRPLKHLAKWRLLLRGNFFREKILYQSQAPPTCD